MPWEWVNTECSIHQVQHTPSAAYTKCSIHRVQYTPSAAYTECSIDWAQHTPSAGYTKYGTHRVLHTPSTAYTLDYLLSLHSRDVELAPECRFSFRRTSLPIDHHQPVLHESCKGKGTSSHSHGFELTYQWIETQHRACLPSAASRSTTCKYSSNPARS